MTKRPFKVIDGTPAPDTPAERVQARMRKQPKPEHLIRCPRCTGIAVIETKIGMTYRAGKPVGGAKQLICAICLRGGEHVVVG